MTTGKMNTTHSSGPASARNETILIVDDEKINLDLTSVLFRNRGFRVQTASNAPDAIDLVGREQPEIVLLDYMMPGMDGFAALTEIRQRFPDTYVIMLTGRGNERIAVELMKAGASDYILKPFLNQDLLERVEKVLKVRDMELRNRELMKERNRLLSEIESWNRELEERVDEKSRELQKVQDEIIQTEKMSTVGFLSAGMAHEIRNPLNSIALYAQLLKGDPEEPDRLECLEKIEQEVRRIDGILRKLMDAVKRPRFHIREVFVDRAIDSAIEMFRTRIEMHGIRVERDFRVIPSPLQADQSEIEQIFTNLIVNSIEEMPDGGVLGVVLDRHGHDVIVRISDTGRGIPPENISKIFDPFFTTKSSGTGLGLYVVLRIVKTYDGRIDVTSEDGKGATFSVFLKAPDAASR